MRQVLAVLTGAIMCLSTSCQSPNTSQTSQKILRTNIKTEPQTLDPRRGGDTISSFIHFLLFEGLTRVNIDGNITLALADSVMISADRTTYTFHLKDSKWSDGSPLTARDFEASWKNILHPDSASPCAYLLYPIKNAEAARKGNLPLSEVGVHAIDDRTLLVRLERPTPYFLDLISFCVFFPVNHIVDAASPDWASKSGPQFVSNGPYRLKEWRHNNEIVVEKNDKYFEADRVKLDQIRISMIGDENTVLGLFENGQIDIMGGPLSSIPVDAVPALIKKGELQKIPVAGTTICAFNTLKPPFDNVNFRKAFAYAVDRQSLVRNITQMNEPIATSAIHPILKKNKFQHFFADADVKLAREYFDKGLKEMGLEAQDLPEITYYYFVSESNHKIAQALQEQWRNVFGITIKLENMDYKVLLDRLYKRDFSIAQTLWLAQYNDQMNIFERFKSTENAKNYSGWSNPEYVKLLDKSAFDETSAERMRTLEQAEVLLLEEMPIAPLFHWNSAYLIQPYVKGAFVTTIGDLVLAHTSIERPPKK